MNLNEIAVKFVWNILQDQLHCWQWWRPSLNFSHPRLAHLRVPRPRGLLRDVRARQGADADEDVPPPRGPHGHMALPGQQWPRRQRSDDGCQQNCHEQIASEFRGQLFTTRMRNSRDIVHAFEIDMELVDGRFVALRGKQTNRHIVTGLCIDIMCLHKSAIYILLNGRAGIEGTIDAVKEIRDCFCRLNTEGFNEEQVAAV